jgi:hypothetical protein
MSDTEAPIRSVIELNDGGIDQVLADSFPASDPPSWTPGIARPLPPPGREAEDLAPVVHAPGAATSR